MPFSVYSYSNVLRRIGSALFRSRGLSGVCSAILDAGPK